MGKPCFSNRALVKAVFEAPNFRNAFFKIVFLRPPSLSRQKPYSSGTTAAVKDFRRNSGTLFSQSIAGTNGRRTAVQIGGALQYKLEMYCGVSLSSKLRSQQRHSVANGARTAVQIGGVLQTILDKLYGWGAPKQCPAMVYKFCLPP